MPAYDVMPERNRVLERPALFHSPAGADPLIVMAAHPSWSFLAEPLALGLAILFVGATLYHRLILHRVYPVQWL